ncbi:hypothetical protein [Primorskyibacter sp. 2E233]|uniref:hypothetical protein n=1 Tax=Primorskyibacter sp. 2E233 TaxID=3413431 RepID=UPI003BF37B1A
MAAAANSLSNALQSGVEAAFNWHWDREKPGLPPRHIVRTQVSFEAPCTMTIAISTVNEDLTPSQVIAADIPVAAFGPAPVFRGEAHGVTLLGYRAAKVDTASDSSVANQTIRTLVTSAHYQAAVDNRFGMVPEPTCTATGCIESSRLDYVQLPFIPEGASTRFEAAFAKLNKHCGNTLGDDHGN